MAPADELGASDQLQEALCLLEGKQPQRIADHRGDAAVFAAQAQDIRAQRASLFEALAQLPGVRAYPSEGNMILVRITAQGGRADDQAAARVFDGMKARGVLIKNVSKMHPMLANCLRLTVGTADENAQQIAALQASI